MTRYLRLYRMDAALIAFFSYLVGGKLATGMTDLFDLLIAAALTLISTNFIYSFNSWADREIDRLSDKKSPVVLGQITPKHALGYSIILFLLSISYPFLVFGSRITLLLFLLLPVLGLVYSLEPLRLRRYPIPAIITISLGLVVPVMLGYFMNNPSGDYPAGFFAGLILFCLSVVPLKQLEQREEDTKTGNPNLFSRFGGKFLVWPLGGLSLFLLVVLLSDMEYILKGCLFILGLSSLVCILVFIQRSKRLHRIYQGIIYLVVIETIGFYILLCFINR